MVTYRCSFQQPLETPRSVWSGALLHSLFSLHRVLSPAHPPTTPFSVQCHSPVFICWNPTPFSKPSWKGPSFQEAVLRPPSSWKCPSTLDLSPGVGPTFMLQLSVQPSCLPSCYKLLQVTSRAPCPYTPTKYVPWGRLSSQCILKEMDKVRNKEVSTLKQLIKSAKPESHIS